MPTLKNIICKECGKEFMPNKKWQEFCNTKCKNMFWNRRISAGLKLLEEAESDMSKKDDTKKEINE